LLPVSCRRRRKARRQRGQRGSQLLCVPCGEQSLSLLSLEKFVRWIRFNGGFGLVFAEQPVEAGEQGVVFDGPGRLHGEPPIGFISHKWTPDRRAPTRESAKHRTFSKVFDFSSATCRE
jgi:hypothetical protein